MASAARRALSVLSASAARAFLSAGSSGTSTADARHGSRRAVAAAWCTGQSRHGWFFHVPRSAASVAVGRDTLVRVRVRDDPSREDPTAAASPPPVFASASPPPPPPEVGHTDEGAPLPAAERHGELPRELPGVSMEGLESAAQESALTAPLSAGGLTKVEASSRGDAVRLASWRVRHIPLAALRCW